MTSDQLFVRTVDDLHRTITSHDEFEVLRAAKSLRQLLLDGAASLVDQVNRTRRLKIRFAIIKRPIPDIPGVGTPDTWCVAAAMEPVFATEGVAISNQNRGAFLGTVIASIGGAPIAVREVIKFVSNVTGGIHLGDPREAKEQALAELRKLGLDFGIDPIIAMLRSIGRITLRALRDLKDLVLSLERFANMPGSSAHSVLVFHPMGIEEDNFIWDFGVDGQNRISMYLDPRGELTARLVTASGERCLVRAGHADCAYTYGQPVYVCCEVGQHQDELLLRLEAGGWYHCQTFKGLPPWKPGEKFHFVLGSNAYGKKYTNMGMFEHAMYSRVLTKVERLDLFQYFQGKMRQGYQGLVRFEGNRFLYSSDHPNFRGREPEPGPSVLPKNEIGT